MKRSLIVLVLLLMMLPSFQPAASGARVKQRTVSERYAVGVDGAVSCETNVGGVCFDLVGDEDSVSLKIADDTGSVTAGIYEVRDASGGTLALTQFCDSATFDIPARSVSLFVYVTGPAFGAINCQFAGGSTGAGTVGTVTAAYVLKGGKAKPSPFDEERECVEPAPDGVSLAGVTDDGSRIALDVMVLLDGVDPATGQKVFDKAAESYAPLGIDLTAQFLEVAFIGDEIHGMLRQAKDLFHGRRPKGSDVVYVLTSKQLTLLGLPVAGGLADCIGGVRYPERAFATGMVQDFTTPVGPLTFGVNIPAKVAAHEIGHLMGGQHHYANCVEGIPSELLDEGEPSACTLMFNSADLVSQNFSTLNGLIVRGHAVEFAAP